MSTLYKKFQLETVFNYSKKWCFYYVKSSFSFFFKSHNKDLTKGESNSNACEEKNPVHTWERAWVADAEGLKSDLFL